MEDASSNSNWRSALLGFVLLIAMLTAIFGAAYWGISSAWTAFSALDKTVAVAIVTASATVTVSTITVVIGRYLERKRESDALHRDKKIVMYDEFLTKIFTYFANEESHRGDSDTPSDPKAVEREMAEFLRESQRKFILWSGPRVVHAYSNWHKSLTSGQHNAKTIFQMEEFYLAIRRDLGHSNAGIKRGDIIRFVLRHTDLFLAAVKENPNITLAELVDLERKLEDKNLVANGGDNR